MASERIDLDMLACDMGDMLSKYDYLDVTDDEIRPHLPMLLAVLRAEIAKRPPETAVSP